MIVGDVAGSREGSRPRPALGRVYATPGAIEVLERAGIAPGSLLERHACGDWGELDAEDWRANEVAVRDGERVLSVYNLGRDLRVWLITEWDRLASTILLPEEY